LFSLFVEFFLGKKKRAAHFKLKYESLEDKFGKTNWVFEFLSEKYPIKKKNHLKWSLGSKVMNILNSTVFQGFSRKICDFLS
jgi:hypothetical protein